MKSLDLVLTSKTQNLVRHKRHRSRQKKHNLLKGKENRGMGGDRGEGGGGWVSLSLQKTSYPLDIKAPYSQEKILLE